MARLWHSGFETGSLTNGVEWTTIASTPTLSSSVKRSGTYSMRISSLGSTVRQGHRFQFAAANGNGSYFFRFFIRPDTLPSADNTIMELLATGPAMIVRMFLKSDGTLQLGDEDGTIGSPSLPLSTGSFENMVEVKFDRTGASGSHVVEARLNGTVFATSSTRALSAGIALFRLGGNLSAEAQTTGDWYFDDVAINDSTGSNQTSYPGNGKIIHLYPDAAGDVNTFAVQVGGTAGAGNNYTRVDEVTPDDATTYNGSIVLSEEDLFNVAASGLVASDSVNVVALGVRMADLVAADATTAFKVQLEKTAAGTKAQSANLIPNSTTWLTNAAAVPAIFPLITYADPDGAQWTPATLDTMQIGYVQSAVGVQTIAISTIFASVEYIPAVGYPKIIEY